ncbi:hypothetical protein NXC14_PA00220 (plasmid) [Rhizobium sp. NXC14]|nr:hypothetical protein NXC14_PA00220 [Rhizobium sp. NXC14]
MLSVTLTGEAALSCVLPRATRQPSARSRRATIRSVGEAAELAVEGRENAITLDSPSLLMRVSEARRRGLF